MATFGGNNSVQDGLVFHYDTGNKLKSYRGEPTVNLAENKNINGFGSELVTTYNLPQPKRMLGESFKNTVTNPDAGDGTIQNNGGIVIYDNIPLNDTSNYLWLTFYVYITKPYIRTTSSISSLSGYARFNDINNIPLGNIFWRIFVDGIDYGLNSDWARKTENLNRWLKVDCQVSIPINSEYVDVIYLYNDHLSSGQMYMTGLQIEQKPHPTPFTPDTRSTTESLLDLTGNTTIDLSNVSFDEDGIYFDGSDRGIITNWGNGVNPSITPFTVEAIVKQDDTTGNRMWFDTAGQGNNQRFYSSLNTINKVGYGIQNQSWGSSVSDTNYHHQTIVMDGTQAIAYDNGVEVHRRNYTPYTLVNNIEFGSRAGGQYFWLGKIPIAKIYNKALTPQEVQQNFNAIKGRFGITSN